MLRHPWSPALLGRPMLGPNVLARTEFLRSTLTRAELEGQALDAATHGLANLTIGSALTESTWRGQPQLSPEAAQEHIRANADTYPTLAASDPLTDDESLFTHAVDCFLTGLAPTAKSTRSGK
jgi:hypothetical protein